MQVIASNLQEFRERCNSDAQAGHLEIVQNGNSMFLLVVEVR